MSNIIVFPVNDIKKDRLKKTINNLLDKKIICNINGDLIYSDQYDLSHYIKIKNYISTLYKDKTNE